MHRDTAHKGRLNSADRNPDGHLYISDKVPFIEGPKEGIHLGASVEIACFNVLDHGGCRGVNAVIHEIGDTGESKSFLKKEKEPFNTVRGFAASCMVDGGGVERSVKQDIRRIEE